ncbi:DUF3667 domain-containing protein [Winogradskyella sp. DF17]|uniref:DUF3667 domain-containing protein n=1 Tax=Winogradskyella pelagia TaxID=2819984 RepID=A0ABS3T476_9FLAO|nr:DUF3667 domain-containing protein [Winogradskyella sp. DF17]MBO3117545.1 DUF3667 domain-containing protein [Winogradskyella sp. DF17]
MEPNKVKCQNCEQPYEEGFQFCPHCGQKTNDELTIGVLFYNTISNYFSFDARFLKSFVPLMFRPGYLAKEFVKGKRLLYLHPAQMYLFVAVIFFFIFNFYVREGREKLDKTMEEVVASRENKGKVSKEKLSDSIYMDSLRQMALKPIKLKKDALGLKEEDLRRLDSITTVEIGSEEINTDFGFNESEIDSLIQSGASNETIYRAMGMAEDAGYFQRKIFVQGLKFYKTMGLGQIYQTFIDSIPLAMFFLMPLFALFFKVFFFKRGRYAHHLVFSFYYFSFLFLLFSLIFAINRWIWDIPDWIDWLLAFSTFFYLVASVIRFYEQNWILSFIKSGIISFFFLLLVVPVSFVMLGFIAFLFY